MELFHTKAFTQQKNNRVKWEKIFTNHISGVSNPKFIKGLTSKIYKAQQQIKHKQSEFKMDRGLE